MGLLYTVHKHSQPTFFLLCEWPIFTPVLNNKQNYSDF